MLKLKCDINQQDLKRVDLHFVKSEQFSLNNLAVKGLIMLIEPCRSYSHDNKWHCNRYLMSIIMQNMIY